MRYRNQPLSNINKTYMPLHLVGNVISRSVTYVHNVCKELLADVHAKKGINANKSDNISLNLTGEIYNKQKLN